MKTVTKVIFQINIQKIKLLFITNSRFYSQKMVPLVLKYQTSRKSFPIHQIQFDYTLLFLNKQIYNMNSNNFIKSYLIKLYWAKNFSF